MKHQVLCVALGLFVAVAAAAARADDTSANDLIQKLVPANGPEELNFRGARLHSIRLTPAPAQPAAFDFDVAFGANSAVLSPEAKEAIRQHRAEFAAEGAAAPRIVVEGYTDAAGRPDENKAISQERAKSVRDFIVAEFGLDPARVEAVGKGSDDLLDPANPQSGVNRRAHVTRSDN